jgi:hypothetical protein
MDDRVERQPIAVDVIAAIGVEEKVEGGAEPVIGLVDRGIARGGLALGAHQETAPDLVIAAPSPRSLAGCANYRSKIPAT